MESKKNQGCSKITEKLLDTAGESGRAILEYIVVDGVGVWITVSAIGSGNPDAVGAAIMYDVIALSSQVLYHTTKK